MLGKKSSSNLLGIFFIFLLIPLFFDSSNLINTPNYFYLSFFVLSFLTCFVCFLIYLRQEKWYKEPKSIFYVIIGILLTGTPLGFFLGALFKFIIINTDFNGEKILKKTALVTNVSSGKYSSLTYEFNNELFQTKDFYYQDYKECKRNCYINLTLKSKPFGMYYVIDIDKKFD